MRRPILLAPAKLHGRLDERIDREETLLVLKQQTANGSSPIHASSDHFRSDEALLAAAQGSISTHRTSTVRLQVSPPHSGPTQPTRIRVEQQRHAFRFGVNAFGWRDDPKQIPYRQHLADLFNAVTIGFYWASYEPQPGLTRHEAVDRVLEWCQSMGLQTKGHPLAWANLADPAWLPDDDAGIQAASLGRVREIVGRFRGRIDTWDVVNEPSLLMFAQSRQGRWAQSIGTDAYVRQHLAAAREANPEATLIVNEVLTPYPVHSLLDSLRDSSGKPLYDAVGLQSHMHAGPWSLQKLWQVCDRYAALGVPLRFSEMTVLSGEWYGGDRWGPSRYEYEIMQRDVVPKVYTLLFGHPAVQEITWWDLSDLGAWRGAAAGLLRADMSPKPAYEQLHDLIRRQWWTRAEGTTNAQGEFTFRAYHGRHRIDLRRPDGREFTAEIEVRPGGENRVEIRIPTDDQWSEP